MNIYRRLQDLMFQSGMWARIIIVMLGIAAAAAPVYGLDLTGTYIRLGINSDGSLVNDAKTLGAKFPDSPSVEFFVPGTPYEGWAVGVNSSLYLANFAPASSAQIPVTVTNTSTGSIKSALVTGTANFGSGRSLAIKRTIAFNISGTSVTFRIELTNTGTTTLTRVAFMEGGDPDQGYALSGDFGTYNDIVFNKRFVRGWAYGGVFPSGLTVGLGTNDTRKVLSVESPWRENPYEVLNSPVDPNGSKVDAEICLAFDFGTLGVGQTVSAEYQMIFGRTVKEADDAFENIYPPDELRVMPQEDFNSVGDEGGQPESFEPFSKDYNLTNIGPTSLIWNATVSQPWLDITPKTGTLIPGGSDTVTVFLTTDVNALSAGDYNDVITFTNVTRGSSQKRDAMLHINRVPGEIEVTDSILPADDNEMPFGEVIVGLRRTEHVTITNTDPDHELIITGISCGFGKGSLFAIRDSYNGTYVINIETGSPMLIGPSGVTSSTCGLAHSGGDVLYGSTWSQMSVIQVDGSGVVVKGNQGMEGTAYDPATNTLYGALNGDFFTVDPATGYRLTSLPDWPDDVEGLDFVPSVGSKGSVYGIDDDGELYCYDVDLKTFTRIGSTGLGIASDNSSLAYVPDLDVLLHITKTTGNLYKINKDTAVATFIANTGITGSTGFSGLAYGPGAPAGSSFMGTPVLPTEFSDPPPPQGEGAANDVIDSQQITTGGNEGSQIFSTTHGKGFFLENLPHLPLTIPGATSVTFDVNFVPDEVTDYNTVLVITSDDRDEAEVSLRLTGVGILDYLEVAPEANQVFSGHPGGPFVPWKRFYQLTNNGPVSINWEAEPNVPWLNVEPGSGSLDPCESMTVTVMPNASAEDVNEGYHNGGVIFTNVTTTIVHARQVDLDVYTEPKIWVRPNSFGATLTQGDSETQVLTIGNGGGSALDFTLSSRLTSFTPAGLDSEGVSAAEINDIIVSSQSGRDFAALADKPHAPGRLLVRFAPTANRTWPGMAVKNSILAKAGNGKLASAQIEKEYKAVRGLSLVKLPGNVAVKDAIAMLNSTPGVLYAEADYELKALSDEPQIIPNDPYFSELWGMHNTGQSGGTAGADINAPEAWDITTGSSSVIVAVIDTGIDYTHPDLAPNMWKNAAELSGTPGVDDDGNGYIDDIYGYDFCNGDGNPMDDHYHGTHCAGTIGAVGNNGQGVAGVCWNVKIMALKFLDAGGSGWTSDAIDCVNYSILMGADLSSNSWGGGGYSQGLKDAINAAGAAGMLFVAAAGNDNTNNDTYPHYPSSYDCNSLIAVLATTRNDTRSSFSCYGLISVDLGAPGSEILSCEPGNSYQYLSGTSMATPHVAGGCALIWSMCPSLFHLDVKDILLETVDPIPSISGMCVSGGRLNVHRAILEAGASCTAPWIEFVPSTGSVASGGSVDVNVIFNADCDAGTYCGRVMVLSNDPYNSNMGILATMTVEAIEYFTELFEPNYFEPNDANYNDMANRTLTFRPNGESSYYSLCVGESAGFPVDPNGGTVVSLGDDGYAPVELDDAVVNLYGTDYNTFFIGSNGYISFESADIRRSETIADHFDLPRISALFDDLDPSAGGTISLKELDDRIAVTFEDVSEYGTGNSNNFQIEMFFDGKLRITFLDVEAEDGLIGISDGNGVPVYFDQSNLSAYNVCDFTGDLNGDLDIDTVDFSIFAADWQKECERENMRTVRDEFNTVSYSGNDGINNWSNNWQESGESDGPRRGILQVLNTGRMQIGAKSRPFGTIHSITREADLSSAVTATLTYDYTAQNNLNAGNVSVKVSGDGGLNWSTLANYRYDSGSGSASFDITPYISSHTTIRFEISPEIKMYLYVDNIQIEYYLPDPPWYPWGSGCDFNRDWKIDFGDLLIFSDQWLK